ncbi:MAG: hypothetical protein GX237_04640 [Clostridiales bacterium]|nr:hypothetical protein [Clostridiales bacterium]
MNKKILKICLTISILFLLSACTRKEDSIVIDKQEKVINYGINDVIFFTVDKGGNLYLVKENSSSIYCYDDKGEFIKKYDIGQGKHTNLCIDGNYIYCFSYLEDGVAFKQVDFTTGKVKEFLADKEIKALKKMEVIKGNIYYVKLSDAFDIAQALVRFDEEDDYFYMNEIAEVYNTETRTSQQLDIDNVILFDKTDKDNLLFYAYDGIGGFYFTTYDTEQGEFGDKTYNNDLGQIFGFAYDSENDKIIYPKFIEQKIYLVDRQDGSVKVELMKDVASTLVNRILYQDGYTYFLDDMSSKIICIDNAKCIKNNKPLKIYQPSYYRDSPPGCGYSINSENISEESFALMVLAGDSDYDLCLMSSDHNFSRSMRDKEPFYPLNDIPEVIAYLDSCFPYLKEAATSESGDIWMIPIAVEANCIVYHEENCKAEGIDFREAESIGELIQIVKNLSKKPGTLNRYGFPSLHINSYAIAQYTDFYGIQDNNAKFDTKLFRDLCIQMSDIMSPSAQDFSSFIYSPAYVGFENYYENYLFELLTDKFAAYDESAYNLLKAIPLPPIEAGVYKSSSVNCIYICVNPNSDNLDSTLDYISDLCKAMSTQVDTFMLKDIDYYSFKDSKLTQDLYDIYSNGIIFFPLSQEIFWDDYLSYHKNEIDLDTLIVEIERKVNAYLKE